MVIRSGGQDRLTYIMRLDLVERHIAQGRCGNRPEKIKCGNWDF